MPAFSPSLSAGLRLLATIALIAMLGSSSPAQESVPSTDSAAPVAADPEGTIPTTSLIKIMQDGGVLMYPILLCSIISLVFVFERAISLRRGRVIPDPFVKRFLHQL